MIDQKKEKMIISNGLLSNLSKFAYILFISIMFSSHAEEIKVAPLNDNDINNDNVIMIEISILNKITTNVERVKLPLKENYHYQELKIYPIDCHLSEPYEKSEVGIYLNIHHKDSNEKIFNGWMLKSLPSISSMEHPIYDIWVEDCI